MSRKFSYRSANRQAAFSQINVTPMVDVMLVLLVIFMVAAPMMTTGVSLDLPRGDGQAMEDSDRAVDISVDEKSKIYLGDTVVAPDFLVTRVHAKPKSSPDLKVVISGDRAAAYGQVIELMSLLRLAGIAKVGLKTGDLMGTDVLKEKEVRKKK